jgi:hypothetical protein
MKLYKVRHLDASGHVSSESTGFGSRSDAARAGTAAIEHDPRCSAIEIVAYEDEDEDEDEDRLRGRLSNRRGLRGWPNQPARSQRAGEGGRREVGRVGPTMENSRLTLATITSDTVLWDSDPIWAHVRRAELCRANRDALVAAGLRDARWNDDVTRSEAGRIEGLRQRRLSEIQSRLATDDATDDDQIELAELAHPMQAFIC